MKLDDGRVRDKGWNEQVNRRQVGLSEGRNAGMPHLEDLNHMRSHERVNHCCSNPIVEGKPSYSDCFSSQSYPFYFTSVWQQNNKQL